MDQTDQTPQDDAGTARADSDDDDPLVLRGRVTSGVGRGREFVRLDGYAEQFEARLGYEPFPGTLNVALDDESVVRRARLDEFDPVRIEPWSDGDRDFGGADCYPVRLPVDRDHEPVHAIVPDRTDHDADELELLAPDRLRDAGLEDGDRLACEVFEA